MYMWISIIHLSSILRLYLELFRLFAIFLLHTLIGFLKSLNNTKKYQIYILGKYIYLEI